jgi:cell division septal protein FtsQ
MTRLAKLYIFVPVAILALLTSYVFFFDQMFFVLRETQIAVEGETWHPQLLEQHKKKWLVRMLAHQNKNLWQVPLQRIDQELRSEPEVAEVVLSRTWPSKVQISIKLKPVVLVFFDGKKTVLPISTSADVLRAIDISLAPDVPFVRNRKILKNDVQRKKMIEHYLSIPHQGVISKSEIAEVDWSEEQGLSIEMADVYEGKIFLGHQEVPIKCKRVANVLKYLESQNQKWRVIDASFAKKVLVRLRKHS